MEWQFRDFSGMLVGSVTETRHQKKSGKRSYGSREKRLEREREKE